MTLYDLIELCDSKEKVTLVFDYHRECDVYQSLFPNVSYVYLSTELKVNLCHYII